MRLSRFSRHSNGRTISEDGQVIIEILRLLDPEFGYSALPTDWLAALLPGDEKHAKTLALDASRDPYRYTERKDYHFKSSVVWRSDKGDDYLIQKGILSRRSRRTRAQRAHDILDAMNDASIELGFAKYPDLELLKWKDILQHPSTPLAVKESLDPFRITVDGAFIIPDGKPFALRHRTNGALGFFKETDRDSEDLGGNARITIDKKLAAWKKAFAAKFWKAYGFPSAFLLIITIDERRERAIHERIKKMFGSCAYICTQVVPDFEHSPFSVKPHTHLIDRAWKRVGYPDFSLATLSDV